MLVLRVELKIVRSYISFCGFLKRLFMCVVGGYTQKSEEGVVAPQVGGQMLVVYVPWVLGSKPLKEQEALLTAKPSL